jgi:hypothetical protein
VNRQGGRIWAGALGTAALLAAGCWTGGRLVLAAREASPEPVSRTRYAQVLAEVDAALRAPFARLGRDDAAYAGTAAALRAGADRLDATTAPEPVTATQDFLSQALRRLSEVVEQAAGPDRRCPAASPVVTVLRSDEAQRVRDKAGELRTADPAYAFGAFLPAAPKQQHRRLPSGTLVRKGDGDGPGELVVDGRGGRTDSAVSLVRNGTPVITVYVRAGRQQIVSRIEAGLYEVFLAAGEDWAAARKGFTRDCTFTRFDSDFRYGPAGTRWTITLTDTAGGNATTDTSSVDPADFPTG